MIPSIFCILYGYWNDPSYQYSVHIYLHTEDATSVETDAEEGSHVLERQGDLIIARGMQQDVSLWEKNSQFFFQASQNHHTHVPQS